MKRPLGDRKGQILVDPHVLGGKPVIKGTRVPVGVVVGSLAGAMSVAEVCEQYRLTPAQVKAALAYAAESLAEERVYALAH
ncbi:MAG TPA: DUF433 domain-containing protein [Planctomycetota bacterium]|nr:DUF433 domain-containing protein [Planctomycetota bacterium]HRR83293.1 DUF433 domain-containing protein [Planctomycetota bacterium]HRT97763.1 DUF433 domain-containing protein [Planctomycetota bacterium]